MGRYTLEVIAPGVEEQLEDALDAVAVVHGGMVVGSSESASSRIRRHYVNIFDCESSLEEEVEWLRERFPNTRFTLKEFM